MKRGDMKLQCPGWHKRPDRISGFGVKIGKSYERVCFNKEMINQQPVAEFICPGHPLLEAVIGIIREKYKHLLKQGAVMLDDSDMSEDVQAVFLVEHEIHDGRKTSSGMQQTISKKMQFATLNEQGEVGVGGPAPHLNLSILDNEKIALVQNEMEAAWLGGSIEDQIKEFAILNLAQAHLKEIKARRLPEIDKVEREVQERLKQEIRYWDDRAMVLKEEEQAGKRTRVNWQNAQRRADELTDRLQRRLAQIAQERNIAASPPVITGVLVIPQGLLQKKMTNTEGENIVSQPTESRREVELLAMDAVMSAEIALGNQPEDVSAEKCGYDILSFDPKKKTQRFIEVKVGCQRRYNHR